MDRTEMITAISAAFLIFFALGWIARMSYEKLRRINSTNIEEIDDLAARLHEAEEQRDEAVTYLQHRENELVNKISQVEAELDAAMHGLGLARRETEVLRRELDGLQRRD